MNLTRIPWLGRREETETGESRVFTDHVRALAAGGPLDSREFETLWAALRAALRSELKKRGLWDSPPSYLGIYGGESWAPADSPAGHDSALEELLAECYSYIFVSRLRSLQAQLKLKPNVDGLVFLNIRHFLHERQREHDPIGSQVFEVLQSAVRLAVEEEELRVLSGDGRVRNDTVLGFVKGMEAPGKGRGELPFLVTRWNDGLLPDLVTSRGKGQEEIVRRLRERLPDLRREGIVTFRFKDLIDPMKADVRARWAALLDLAFGESAPQKEGLEAGTVVRLVEPDQGVEERELFHKLVDCVLTSLDRLEIDAKTRGYLAVLWQFLRVQASEGMEMAVVSRLDRALQAEAETMDEERPSLRKLAEQLNIPRERLPALYKTLGGLLEKCRAANSGETAVTLLKGKSAHDGKP
ncbi:MAG TPA: hypothetical protein VLQ45_10835 [Thermoanaerobaculia bacterium]|nr:hypothetical protein [Thermoanaerobaculia bacterium]